MFVMFIVLIVCAALYFYTAAQASQACALGISGAFVVDRIIYRFTKTTGSFFFVRFALFSVINVPTQLIYNAAEKNNAATAWAWPSLYLGALCALLVLLAERNKRAFGKQML